MPIHPLRNTVAGEITKGGNEREVGKMLLQKRWRWCTVYVPIFVSYLFRSHASSKPHKKKKKRDF